MVSNLAVLIFYVSVISQSSRECCPFRKPPRLPLSETRLNAFQVYDYSVTMDMEVCFTSLYCLTILKSILISGQVRLDITAPSGRSIVLHCAVLALFRPVYRPILSVLASGPPIPLTFTQTLLGPMFRIG